MEWWHEDRADTATLLRGERTAGVRRRAWLLLRKLQRGKIPRSGAGPAVRAIQCVALGAWCAAWPALSVAQSAGQAGQRAGGRSVRRGGGHPSRLADVRPVGRR